MCYKSWMPPFLFKREGGSKVGKILILIILAILISRVIFIATRDVMSNDEYAHVNTARYIMETGRIDMAGKHIDGYSYPNYPPVFHLLLAGSMMLFGLSGTQFLFAVFISIGLFLVFYKILEHFMPDVYALIVSIVFIFSPYTFYWGSILYTEGIVLLLILSGILGVLKKNPIVYYLSIMLVSVIKPYFIVFFLPFFFVSYLIKRDKMLFLVPTVLIPTFLLLYNQYMVKNMEYAMLYIRQAIDMNWISSFIQFFHLSILLIPFLLFFKFKRDILPFLVQYLVIAYLFVFQYWILGFRWGFYLIPFILFIFAYGMFHFIKDNKTLRLQNKKKVLLFLIIFVLVLCAYTTTTRSVFSYRLHQDYKEGALFFENMTGNIYTPFQAEVKFYAENMNVSASLTYMFRDNSSSFNNMDYIWVSKIWLYSYWYPKDKDHWFYDMLESPCLKPVFENNHTLIYERKCDVNYGVF